MWGLKEKPAFCTSFFEKLKKYIHGEMRGCEWSNLLFILLKGFTNKNENSKGFCVVSLLCFLTVKVSVGTELKDFAKIGFLNLLPF